MLRVPMSKAYLKRTIRPLYGWTQATPKDEKLDPAWDRSVPIWPGMVAAKTKGDLVTLIGAAPMIPLGLFGCYIGGDGIDELLDAGVNSCPVWVLGNEAEFEVLAPAFASSLSWVDPANGSRALIYAQTTSGVPANGTRGQLVPAGTTGASVAPVATLIRVDSATKIIVGGLTGTT